MKLPNKILGDEGVDLINRIDGRMSNVVNYLDEHIQRQVPSELHADILERLNDCDDACELLVGMVYLSNPPLQSNRIACVIADLISKQGEMVWPSLVIETAHKLALSGKHFVAIQERFL